MHDVDECRIISLFSNIGTADESGFITAGDDEAATRMLGVQWKLGLRPEFVMPWNVHPWHVPGEPNGKFTPDQISAGLKPLLKFLALVPRASVIVAHGTEANRLANLLLKTEVPMIWRRGLKTYKVRSLSGRAFAGTPARQEAVPRRRCTPPTRTPWPARAWPRPASTRPARSWQRRRAPTFQVGARRRRLLRSALRVSASRLRWLPSRRDRSP